MEIKNEYPPNWEKIKSVFPVESAEVVMVYDGVLYNPFKLQLRDDIVHHEEIHAKQQENFKAKGGTMDQWWEKYVADPKWRVEVEAAAYGKQVKFIRQRQGEARAAMAIQSFSKFLSGPVYGEAIDKMTAFEKIRKISRSA